MPQTRLAAGHQGSHVLVPQLQRLTLFCGVGGSIVDACHPGLGAADVVHDGFHDVRLSNAVLGNVGDKNGARGLPVRAAIRASNARLASVQPW